MTQPTPRNNCTVRILSWDMAQPLARPLREAVFVIEQGVPLELEWDEWDAASEHAVALAPDGTAVGTGRLLPPVDGAGRIGRMAVKQDWRGRGIGAAILLALVERARERGMTAAMLHAQTHAVDFYKRYGFVEEGGEFMEDGIPHFRMQRMLA